MFQLPDGGPHDYVELFGMNDPDAAYMTTGPVPGFLVDDVVQGRKELPYGEWIDEADPAGD
jgi:hypothetical protein